MNPRSSRVAGPAIVVVVALIVLVWALGFGGGAAELSLGDAGPVARWGLPVAKLFVNLAAAGMVGVLVTALFTLRAGEREFDVAMDSASISAAVFTVAAGATGFLTFISVFNPELNAGPQFGTQLGRFLVELEVGRTWLITTVAGAALTVFTFAVRSWASRGIPRVGDGDGDASVSRDHSHCRPGNDRHSPLLLGQVTAAKCCQPSTGHSGFPANWRTLPRDTANHVDRFVGVSSDSLIDVRASLIRTTGRVDDE